MPEMCLECWRALWYTGELDRLGTLSDLEASGEGGIVNIEFEESPSIFKIIIHCTVSDRIVRLTSPGKYEKASLRPWHLCWDQKEREMWISHVHLYVRCRGPKHPWDSPAIMLSMKRKKKGGGANNRVLD